MSDDVPPFTLQVGSRWPAYDADNLIQLTLIQRGLAEGFPTSDFRPSGNVDRTERGTRLRFGCAYTHFAGAEGSCAYGFDLDPSKDEEFPCMRVTKVCLKHDHPHDLPPAVWEACKKHEEEYLPKGSRPYKMAPSSG